VDIPAANNPITTSVTAASRAWTDRNKNYIPDCDLGNFALNGECGVINNQNFGKNNPRATRWDDAVLRGWGVRDSNWDFSGDLQHQLRENLSVTGGYTSSIRRRSSSTAGRPARSRRRPRSS
jgi:hypothetical protein